MFLPQQTETHPIYEDLWGAFVHKIPQRDFDAVEKYLETFAEQRDEVTSEQVINASKGWILTPLQPIYDTCTKNEKLAQLMLDLFLWRVLGNDLLNYWSVSDPLNPTYSRRGKLTP